MIAQLDSKDWQARRDAVRQLGKLAEQPSSRELVERAVADRLSGERDVDVREAMLKLLRRLGTDVPASETKPIPLRSEMRANATSHEEAEPVWKNTKWLMLAGGVGLAVIVLIGAIVTGVRSYQRLATVASIAQQQTSEVRAAAEQARQAIIVSEAARQREADAAKQREAEAAKQKEAAAALQLAEAAKQREIDAAKQRDADAAAAKKSQAQLQALLGAQSKIAPSTENAAELQQLAKDFELQKAQAAQVEQQLASLQKTNAATAQIAGSEFKDCAECPSMVTIPGGSFTMGSSESARARDEVPQHRVTIAKNIAVGKFEVTFAEWDACVADGGCNGYKPDDGGWGRANHPVVNVNWNDAQTYIAWLRRKTNKPYRLLSEAEWEYAARAQTVSAYYWGASASTASARYNARDGTAPVGSYAPNSFGLYDMSGNVAEWAQDCLTKNYEGAPADGSAWMTGDCDLHALRGGGWNHGANNLRSGNRDWDATGLRVNRNGFRVARGL